jgi:predicted lipid-binding transport protein (Tim44 family)
MTPVDTSAHHAAPTVAAAPAKTTSAGLLLMGLGLFMFGIFTGRNMLAVLGIVVALGSWAYGMIRRNDAEAAADADEAPSGSGR